MKRHWKSILIAAVVLLLLCSCDYERRVVGTWVGDGTMDILGMEAPIEFVHSWTFRADGTAVAEKRTSDGVLYTEEFTYSMTDDTIGWSLDGISYALVYRIKGNTLMIETGNGDAVFEKEA